MVRRMKTKRTLKIQASRTDEASNDLLHFERYAPLRSFFPPRSHVRRNPCSSLSCQVTEIVKYTIESEPKIPPPYILPPDWTDHLSFPHTWSPASHQIPGPAMLGRLSMSHILTPVIDLLQVWQPQCMPRAYIH